MDLTVLGRRGGFLGPLGASGRPLGNLCEASWASWDVLKASGGLLEASWGLMEASWGVIGPIIDKYMMFIVFSMFLVVGHAQGSLKWAHVGSKSGQVDPTVGPSRPKLAPKWP